MKRFKKVYIEITNVCNLSCNFCPKTGRKLQFSDEERFKEIIEKVKPYTDYVYFHLMGEPLLNKNLARFLDICYENGLKVNITTNGTLLAKEKNVLINAKALRQVNISLHSFEANKVTKELEEYVSEVIDFINEAKENIICSIRLWNMDNGILNLKGKNTLNDDILKMLQEGLNSEIDIKEALSNKPGIKVSKNVYINSAEKFEWPNINRAVISESAFCYGLRDQIGILVDGTVVPCCLDSEGNIPLGNIFESSLENILNSKRAKDLYEGFSNRKAVEELCKRCGYVTRYSK